MTLRDYLKVARRWALVVVLGCVLSGGAAYLLTTRMDKVYQAEGMAQIRKDPLKYLRLCGYRFFQLFTNIGVKTTYGVELNTTDHVMLVQQLAYLALAFTGIAWGFRAHWPWLLAIGVQVAGYTALVAQGRYLTPVMPLLIAFAGLALDRLIGRTRSADR